MEIKIYLNSQREIVENALSLYMLKAGNNFRKHIESMRYSLFVGGKRIRPILCLAAAEAVTYDTNIAKTVLPVACALECIHTYSLIHDDLPAMDNDDLRRGKPTNHTVFGEAEAILAGDGLLTFAFELLSDPTFNAISDKTRLDIIYRIARAAGSLGMVGGQSLDIENEGKETTYSTLQTIHRSKTGALITVSLQAGCLAAGGNDIKLKRLTEFGNYVGLAFQIVDDLLNVESTTEQLGKAAGSDAEKGKATYPALFGVDKTRKMANEAVSNALNSLIDFDHKAEPLRELAKYIINRKK